MKEGYKLEDTIILNGKVGWVNTGDDADSIIGIQNIQKVKRFSGEEIVVSNNGFAFSKEMESRCAGGLTDMQVFKCLQEIHLLIWITLMRQRLYQWKDSLSLNIIIGIVIILDIFGLKRNSNVVVMIC